LIYIDSSIVLAQLLTEDRQPSSELWREPLVASRLVEYETWNRIHARALTHSHSHAAQALLARLHLLELTPDVLGRALDPFPVPVRTLDALHLASIDYLLDQGLRPLLLATYDTRLARAAVAVKIDLYVM
jgi:predicted nucleic acid-binding protein